MGKRKSNQRNSRIQPAASIDEPHEPDLARAFDLVMQLMAIPGKTAQERQVADFITEHLRKAGAPASAIHTDSAHRRTPVPGQIGNLALRLPGTMRAPRRLLSAHLDTVPICVGSQPVREGELVRSANPKSGLGADNRAGCAVLLCAAIEILTRKLPHPPLTFCWFVQEETGLNGSRHLTKSLLANPQLAFNFDGGAPTKLTIGATGGYRMLIEIEGIASHAGGAPEAGVSAIAIASLAIADLHQSGWHGDIARDGKHGTSNVGYISGGEATNVVTDHVTLKAEARSHDPKFRKRIIREMEQAFQRAAKEVRNMDGECGKVKITGHLDYESFLLKTTEPCVDVAGQAIRSIGEEPQHAIANGGVDANWLTAHGIPAVTLGCGQKYQHMVSELLNVKEFELACRIGLRLATATELK
ncbi:MAG: M20/M25/M40 family metallo-hydrolase [Cephaloticoccus sp.]|nr:M20/M25/M40 family metallo-hydrolase [Planctomycetales bacterium]MCB1104273.1 M20/M25/M40 family metallo-hydrolase [Cephaloticoccus sp.]MCB9922083.1 M20/M25/M40 family metallo-hydrolase [Planctomycetaceae bacterium]